MNNLKKINPQQKNTVYAGKGVCFQDHLLCPLHNTYYTAFWANLHATTLAINTVNSIPSSNI